MGSLEPRARRGFALAYFLIISVLIAMFTGAVLVVSKDTLFASRGGVDANRSLYAAEAGLARAIAELERNPAWTGGFDAESLPDGMSKYSVRFASSPSGASEQESINNLLGSTAVASYRGPHTVPPHSALLVVEGVSGLGKVTVEALVVSGMNVVVGDALTATGTVELAGHVDIRGQTTLADTSPVAADLHTNSTESTPRVRYASGASGGVEVTGHITSSSRESVSAVFDVAGSGLPASKLRSDVPQKSLPRPNIEAIVNDHAGSNGPPIPGTPGEMIFTGNNHYSGDVTINGDVELVGNAGLYVEGNLTINGSLRGRGTVVVTGNSTFYGDSDVGFRETDYVSLMSGGHVLLQGFKGQQYLEGLAQANPTITRTLPPLDTDPLGSSNPSSPNYPGSLSADLAWTNLQAGLRGVQELLASDEVNIDEEPIRIQNLIQAQDQLMDAYMSVISHHSHGAAQQGLSLSGIGTRTHNNAGVLRGYMESQGGGPLSASRFLEQRFQLLGDLFRRAQTSRDGEHVVSLPPWVELPDISAFGFFYFYDDWDPSSGGIFDAMQSETESSSFDGIEQQIKELVQAIQQFDYDRLGSAHYRGIVYTNGAFVATDDVVVQGTVMVNGNPNLPAPLVVDLGGSLGTRTFQPGDVGLFGYTSLVYVEEFFHDGVHNLAGGGSLGVQRWVAR